MRIVYFIECDGIAIITENQSNEEIQDDLGYEVSESFEINVDHDMTGLPLDRVLTQQYS